MPSELGPSIGRFGLIAAGGYAFGPIGAAAGALLGGFLFGSSGPKIEGPRLGDLDVSSSTYGGVIPVGFGVQKVAGTIIWATDIDEDKNTRKEGGSLLRIVRPDHQRRPAVAMDVVLLLRHGYRHGRDRFLGHPRCPAWRLLG